MLAFRHTRGIQVAVACSYTAVFEAQKVKLELQTVYACAHCTSLGC